MIRLDGHIVLLGLALFNDDNEITTASEKWTVVCYEDNER